jgi:probable HAF family extracellular repeat protein
MNRRNLTALLIVFAICFWPTTSAAIYTLTNLGAVSGANSSVGRDVNSLGQVVGDSNIKTGPISSHGPHSFLWTPNTPNGNTGSMTDLGVSSPNSDFSTADKINTVGQVAGQFFPVSQHHAYLWTPNSPNGNVGSFVDVIPDPPSRPIEVYAEGINSMGQLSLRVVASSVFHSYLWTPSAPNGSTGSTVDLGLLPLPGSNFSDAGGINDMGQVTGASGNASGAPRHAFLWTPTTPNGSTGSMIDLGDLPGGLDYSGGSAVNSIGQVAGFGQVPGTAHAFLWTPTTPNGTTGSMIDLGDLPGGGDHSIAVDINASGQVIGGSDSLGGERPFLWTPTSPNGTVGSMVDVNTLLDPVIAQNWRVVFVYGINDAGQIVGDGRFDPDGVGPLPEEARGILLTPVPEASTITLAALSVFAAFVRFARRLPATY